MWLYVGLAVLGVLAVLAAVVCVWAGMSREAQNYLDALRRGQ